MFNAPTGKWLTLDRRELDISEMSYIHLLKACNMVLVNIVRGRYRLSKSRVTEEDAMLKVEELSREIRKRDGQPPKDLFKMTGKELGEAARNVGHRPKDSEI